MKWVKRIAMLLAAVVLIFLITSYFYLQRDLFGDVSSGERLTALQHSPHFRDGKFINRITTPEIAEGYSMSGVMYDFMFNGSDRKRPVDVLPSVRTDLHSIPADQDILVWFGHSSYYVQVDGKRFLVDPVFSGNASPVPGTNTAFAGTDAYTADDLPEIDYVIISHDHYDHTDYETLLALQPKVKKVICGLGVGAHFERWGYARESIIEKDWYEDIVLDGVTIHTTPARHFSGRGLTSNTTLWMSYVIQTPTFRFYIGGDSGYDTHFAEIGNTFGPIDLAMIDNGQYDSAWRYVHTLPEEVMLAAKDLKTRRLFPVHSSKFAMANHAWDEPLRRITKLNETEKIPLVTPVIGELVYLRDEKQTFRQWWIDYH